MKSALHRAMRSVKAARDSWQWARGRIVMVGGGHTAVWSAELAKHARMQWDHLDIARGPVECKRLMIGGRQRQLPHRRQSANAPSNPVPCIKHSCHSAHLASAAVYHNWRPSSGSHCHSAALARQRGHRAAAAQPGCERWPMQLLGCRHASWSHVAVWDLSIGFECADIQQ